MKVARIWGSEVQCLEKEDKKRVREARRHYHKETKATNLVYTALAVAMIFCSALVVVDVLSHLIMSVIYNSFDLVDTFENLWDRIIQSIITVSIVWWLYRYKVTSIEERVGMTSKFRRHWIIFTVVCIYVVTTFGYKVYTSHMTDGAKYLNAKIDELDECDAMYKLVGSREWIEDFICFALKQAPSRVKCTTIVSLALQDIVFENGVPIISLSDYAGDNVTIQKYAKLISEYSRIFGLMTSGFKGELTDEELEVVVADAETLVEEMNDYIHAEAESLHSVQGLVVPEVYKLAKLYIFLFVISEIIRSRNTKRFMKQEGYLVERKN